MKPQRTRLALTIVAATSACVTPPGPPEPRAPATAVAASAGKTWDAALDVLSERNIPISAVERASGFIATDRIRLSDDYATAADCGAVLGDQRGPERAIFNVLVRGDSSSSTIRVTAHWTRSEPGGESRDAIDCSSKGTWETAFESDVKRRAERERAGGK